MKLASVHVVALSIIMFIAVATTVDMLFDNALITAIALIAVGAVALIMSTYSMKSIRTITEHIKEVARGTLKEIPVIGGTIEAITLSTTINKLVGMLRTFINNLKEVSSTLMSQATQVKQASSQISTSIQQVSQAIQEVAKGAQITSQRVQELDTMFKVIKDKLNTMAEEAKSILTQIEKARSLGEESLESGRRVKEMLRTMIESLEDTLTKMNELNTAMKSVSEVSARIKDIADQISLLALNAAIEAARAGEAGRGFAVVADEIRKLAEDTRKSTEVISDVLTKIENSVRDVDSSLTTLSEKIKVTREGTERLIDAVDKMSKSQLEIADFLSRQSNDVLEMNEKINEASEKLTELASVAEENASAAQEVSSAVEETTAASEQLAASAAELEEIANKIQDIINKAGTGRIQ